VERLRRSPTLTIIFFGLVTCASFLAHITERPITSALVYVMGVMVIGAARGRRSGLIAAIVASLTYSILIKNPALHLEEISLEYYVPLITFNLTALLSGTLAGVLKDRAQSAEDSRNQLDLLLGLSSELQRAVRVEDVARALQSTVSPAVIGEQILPSLEQRILLDETQGLRQLIDIVNADASTSRAGTSHFETADIDLKAFVDLLAMAIERCDLLDGQAENEAIKRSEDLKTALLSSLSHDLRTPIAAISASATSLARFGDTLTADVKGDMLGTIQDQCARLDRFTSKLLSFGRLQGGVVARELEQSDIVELLGNAVSSARLAGPAHHVHKELPDIPVIVMANPAMLEQVFFNIIENAVIYNTPGSEILIRVEIANDRARIIIRDFGRGVSEDEMGHIFEPFFRSNNSRTTNGQGLGLFIAKGFVEVFGGTISAQSPHTGGQGLEIAIDLPMAQVAVEGG
jgi:two-component system sensor histidine kinase KdpD